MNALNLALFRWIAAGNQPTPWVLSVATGFALWGSWLSSGLLVVALWRHCPERACLRVVAAMAGATSLVAHAIALSLNVARQRRSMGLVWCCPEGRNGNIRLPGRGRSSRKSRSGRSSQRRHRG